MEARDLFRQLYERTRQPCALAREALAEGAAGQWVEAEEHMLTALASEADPWVRMNRQNSERALSTFRTHLASLEIVCPTAGAEVWMAGHRVSPLPLPRPLRVIAGSVTFEVRAEDHIPASRTILLQANGRGREEVALQARPRREVTPLVQVGSYEQHTVADQPAPRWMRPVGITLMAAGIAGLVVGGVGYALQRDAQARWDDQNCDRSRPDCASIASDLEGVYAPMTVAGLVTGGVALAAGVALWIAAPSSARQRAGAGCGLGGPGALCTILF